MNSSIPKQQHATRGSPDLFCIVEFDLRTLLDEFGVLLQVFDAPLRMLLQVVKLILQDGREAIDQVRNAWEGGDLSIIPPQMKVKECHKTSLLLLLISAGINSKAPVLCLTLFPQDAFVLWYKQPDMSVTTYSC